MQTFLQLFQRRLLAALPIFAGLKLSSAFLLAMATKARFSPRSGTSTLTRLPRRSLSRSASPSRPSRAKEEDFFGKLLALGVILIDVGFQDVGVGRELFGEEVRFPRQQLAAANRQALNFHIIRLTEKPEDILVALLAAGDLLSFDRALDGPDAPIDAPGLLKAQPSDASRICA